MIPHRITLALVLVMVAVLLAAGCAGDRSMLIIRQFKVTL
jgi:hypothetical protein